MYTEFESFLLIFCLFAQNQPIHERDSVTIDLFGRWQTEKYKPPPAKDVRSLKTSVCGI